METTHDTFRPFRRSLIAVIALDALLGLWLWAWPESLLGLLGIGLPDPLTWVRLGGLAILLVGLAGLPALIAPLHNRLVVVLAVSSRALLALFFLFAAGPLWPLALYAALLGAWVAVRFWQAWRDDLMAKP